MNSKKLGLKEIVLITLLTAIMIGIQTVVLIPFMTNLKFVLWFVGGIDWFLLCLYFKRKKLQKTRFFCTA